MERTQIQNLANADKQSRDLIVILPDNDNENDNKPKNEEKDIIETM
jgi:hypothetical protein